MQKTDLYHDREKLFRKSPLAVHIIEGKSEVQKPLNLFSGQIRVKLGSGIHMDQGKIRSVFIGSKKGGRDYKSSNYVAAIMVKGNAAGHKIDLIGSFKINLFNKRLQTHHTNLRKKKGDDNSK